MQMQITENDYNRTITKLMAEKDKMEEAYQIKLGSKQITIDALDAMLQTTSEELAKAKHELDQYKQTEEAAKAKAERATVPAEPK